MEEIAHAFVAFEGHFTVPALVRRIDPGAISRRGFRPRKAPAKGPNPLELLRERTGNLSGPMKSEHLPALSSPFELVRGLAL